MAGRLERAHAQLLGQDEGVLVVSCGQLNLRGFTLRRNRAQEVQGIRLVAAFPGRTRQHQRALGEGVRFLQVARQPLRLSQRETTERLLMGSACRCALVPRLREQRHGVGQASGQGIRCLPRLPPSAENWPGGPPADRRLRPV